MGGKISSLPLNFLAKAVSFISGSSYPISTTPKRQNRRFAGDKRHAAAESYLVTAVPRFKLLSFICLGVGYRLVTQLLALALYAILLMPGFLQVGYQYFYSSNVRRNIRCGDQPRNSLDLYLPINSDGSKPVVVFVTGGAWIIGNKAWGSLLGLQLAEKDIIVACLDYRNFPQGTISDMIEDVSQGIAYICRNIIEFGGDPEKIYLVGQSAGAHISACALIQQASKESMGHSVSWNTSHIKAYFGLSGGYNLPRLVDHFHGRGLYRSIFLSIMEGEKSLERFSPEIMIRSLSSDDGVVPLLPRMVIFHGAADYSIPLDASAAFADALRSAGAQVELIMYQGKTHTDLFVYDPLRGGKDELFDYLVEFIHSDGGDAEALAEDVMARPRKRYVPEILVRLASKVSPF